MVYVALGVCGLCDAVSLSLLTASRQILRSLNKTYQVMKKKPMWVDLNPKAVTPNELFGFINPATREWKDGTQPHTRTHTHTHTHTHMHAYIHTLYSRV